MNHARSVLGCDLHRGVRGAGGRAADQQRDLEFLPRHLAGDRDHLVERRRDQSGEPDDVDLFLARRGEDLLRRHHHAEIGDLVVVAGEHDADDVLADVVNVAFHRGHEHAAVGPGDGAGGGEAFLFLLHVRGQVGDGLLHHARGLHHLREKHLPGAKQIADDAHAVHERALDDVQGPRILLPRFLRVGVDKRVDALHERMAEPLFDGSIAPGEVLFDFRFRRAALQRLEFVGKGHEPLGGIGPAIEEDILDPFQQVLGDLLIDAQHAGVDDRHVHARADGMVEERRVHRLAHRVVAAKRE